VGAEEKQVKLLEQGLIFPFGHGSNSCHTGAGFMKK
jgi:hypothetical protein